MQKFEDKKMNFFVSETTGCLGGKHGGFSLQ